MASNTTPSDQIASLHNIIREAATHNDRDRRNFALVGLGLLAIAWAIVFAVHTFRKDQS